MLVRVNDMLPDNTFCKSEQLSRCFTLLENIYNVVNEFAQFNFKLLSQAALESALEATQVAVTRPELVGLSIWVRYQDFQVNIPACGVET